MIDRDKFDRWAAKAPVRHYGPQRTAMRLARELALDTVLLPDERHAVSVGISHALCSGGENRSEFDTAVAQIRKRVFPDTKEK